MLLALVVNEFESVFKASHVVDGEGRSEGEYLPHVFKVHSISNILILFNIKIKSVMLGVPQVYLINQVSLAIS
jgi:hypothetical protein